tara:strand:- start:357 stop:1007 length:651 start_codon:yes stop_codon:yes gene_type:complete
MEESNLNKNMVDGQIKPINGMNDDLLSIFYSLDRLDFMPEALKKMSYMEKNHVLDENRTILKPEIIARIALSIDLKQSENVLILGCSTGYLTAILSYQAETVIVVEETEDLLINAEISIKKYNINNVVFCKNEIIKGYLEQSPFNVIIIEGAIESVPTNILDQLDDGGRLFAIISEKGICSAKLYKKIGQKFNELQLFNCSLPPLDIFKSKNSFSF